MEEIEKKEKTEGKIVKFDLLKFECWKSILGEDDAARLYAEVLPKEELARLSPNVLDDLLREANFKDNANYEFALELSLSRLGFVELFRKYLSTLSNVKFDLLKFECWKSIFGEDDAARLYAEVLPKEELASLSPNVLDDLLREANFKDNANYEFALELSLSRLGFVELFRKYLSTLSNENTKKELFISLCKNRLLNFPRDSFEGLQEKCYLIEREISAFEQSARTYGTGYSAGEDILKLIAPIVKALEKRLLKEVQGLSFAELLEFYKKAPKEDTVRSCGFRFQKLALDVFVQKCEQASFQETLAFLCVRSINYHEIRSKLREMLQVKGTLADWLAIYKKMQTDPRAYLQLSNLSTSNLSTDFIWAQIRRFAAEN